MSEIKILHAESAFEEPDAHGCKILYVTTKLAENPGTIGFDADAKHEMLGAIAKRLCDPETPFGQCDDYVICWSDSANARRT